MADAPQTITIDDRQRAYAASAAPLEAPGQRIETRPPRIAFAGKPVPNAQLAAVERRAAPLADAAGRRAMPLCGVPFAVTGSIDVVAIFVRAYLAAVGRASSAAGIEVGAR